MERAPPARDRARSPGRLNVRSEAAEIDEARARAAAVFDDALAGMSGLAAAKRPRETPRVKEKEMLYAMLAYHVEAEVTSWTPEEDAALMTELLAVHNRLNAKRLLGPSARLGATAEARTLRGPGAGMVIDGPFAETKEQLLGLYVLNCADEDEAIGIARDLRRVNPSAVYEIRPIRLYLPGEALPETASEG
ncbi:hypothetical protein V1279_004065 [Bradyrhizobium sp. AZCC 1610]